MPPPDLIVAIRAWAALTSSGPRSFVGPMDHSYREVNGNFADGPPSTIDTGNVVFLKLSGAGLVDGDQELVVGGGVADETSTSVTSDTAYLPATYQRCFIRVKPGNDVYCSASYNGTDSGTQVIAVTLEVQ